MRKKKVSPTVSCLSSSIKIKTEMNIFCEK